MRKIKNCIPNAITLLNILSGTLAITFAFEPADIIAGLEGWKWSVIFIGAAAVFDFLDGFAARLLRAQSSIGAELDSLCDVVSFGVAPSLLLLNVMRLDASLQTDPYGPAYWWSFAALFIPMMGALRLARFNVRDAGDTTFRGLPIPANAIFWIGYVSALMSHQFQPRMTLNLVIIVLISLLMVSDMKMFSLKLHSFGLIENLGLWLTLIGSILFVIFFGLSGLALAILLYIAISFLQSIIHIRVSRD